MENQNSKKNYKKAIIIAIIGILVVGLAYGSIVFKKPENKILMGAAKLAESDEIKYTAKLSTDFTTGVNEFDALIKSLELQVKSYINVSDGDNKIETAVLIDNKEAIDISLANIDEYVYLELPGVTENVYFYQLDEDIKNNVDDYTKIIKYVQDIDFDALYKGEYKKLINKYLEDNSEEKDGKVILTINSGDITEFTKKLLEEAENDKGLAEDIYDIIVDLGKEMENDKFEPKSENFKQVVKEIKTFKENISKKDFVEEFNTSLVEMSKSLSQQSGIASQDMEIKISFEFGLLNNIKTLSYECELYGANVVLDMDFTQGASKPKYSKDNGIDMSTITEKEATDIAIKTLENVTKNKKVQDAITASGILSMLGYDDIDLFIEDMTNNLSEQYLY